MSEAAVLPPVSFEGDSTTEGKVAVVGPEFAVNDAGDWAMLGMTGLLSPLLRGLELPPESS